MFYGLRNATLVGILLLASPSAGRADPPSPEHDSPGFLRLGKLPETPYHIVADEIAYEPRRELYEAHGNVRLEQKSGGFLTADWIVFNRLSGLGVASGNVVIEEGSDHMEADFAAVDLNQMVALATRAQLSSENPSFVFEGDTIEKTGFNTYRIESGTFSTCACRPAADGRSSCRPWEIESSEANLHVGGYAVARHVRFKIRDVPVLYSPWVVLPVKTKRQTGFLLPSFGSDSRDGSVLDVPFLWAERKPLNLLFHPEIMSRRGFKPRVNFEYVFGETGTGEGGVSGLFGDRRTDRSDPGTPFSDNRWAVWLEHEQTIGPHTRFGLDLKALSDNHYVIDFQDLDPDTRNARFLESSSWLTNNQGSRYAQAELSYVDDLQSPENLDRDRFLLQRLPDLRFAELSRRLGPLPLRVGMEARYTYFYQRADPRTLHGIAPFRKQFFDTGPDGLFNIEEPNRQGIFDGLDNSGDDSTTQGDGIFQEGELLADHGHRADVYPRVSWPLRLGGVETLSEAGFRETFYVADHGGSEHREIWTGRADARMRFQHGYRLFQNDVQQILEPRIGFTVVEAPDQSGNPLFIPRSTVRLKRLIDQDTRLLTRDPSDRVNDERIVQASIRSRLYARRHVDPAAKGNVEDVRRLGEMRLGGGYDFLEGRLANVFFTGTVAPSDNVGLTVDLGFDPKQRRIDEALLNVGWTPESGYEDPAQWTATGGYAKAHHELVVNYRYLSDFANTFENFNVSDGVFEDFDSEFNAVSQLGLSLRWIASARIELFGNGFVSLNRNSNGAAGAFGFRLKSACKCWQISTALRQQVRPARTRVDFSIQLTGLGRAFGHSYSRSYAPEKPQN